MSSGPFIRFLPFAANMTFAAGGGRRNPAIPNVAYRGGIYYLVLDGATAYARGFQHGKALSFPIQLALHHFKDWIKAHTRVVDPENLMKEFVARTGYIQSAQSQAPDLYEEMQGVAAGAGRLIAHEAFDRREQVADGSGHASFPSMLHAVRHGTRGRRAESGESLSCGWK